MKRKLFLQTFLCAIAVTAICFSLTLMSVYDHYTLQNQRQLKEEAAYLATAVEAYGADFLERVDTSRYQRITWVGTDGAVLFDNVVDPATMENHGSRQEVLEARAQGEGWSIRYSDTRDAKTTNYALLLEDGTVLRLSGTEQSVLTLVWDMIPSLLLTALLAALCSLVLAYGVSRRLLRPVNAIDLDAPDETAVYPELRPLVRRINAQQAQLHRQMELLVREHDRQDRLRREFTANVSHELKTPLTSISGYAEIIREGIARPEDVKGFADTIHREAQRLQHLVGDIIQLSELEELSDQIAMEPVDLLPVCQSALQRYRPLADRLGIELSWQGTPQIVQGSEKLLAEMVNNLCSNAIKYNREGGSVTLTLERIGDQIVLSVRDTGIGIPVEDQERVFERFYRVDKSHSKAIGGTGLGLAIVKHGAACHKARIRMESRLGQGTEIALVFPVPEAADAQS